MELANTYTLPFTRNFQVDFLKTIIKPHLEKFTPSYETASGLNGWEKCTNLLNTIIKEESKSNIVDEQLFNKLVFEIPDHVYLRPLVSDIDAHEFITRHSKHPAYNRKLSRPTHSGELLQTIRRIDNKVILVFKVNTFEIGNSTSIELICPCIMDFDKKLFIIRTKIRYVQMAQNTNLTQIMSLVEAYLTKNFQSDVAVSEYNPDALHQMLFNIFKTESENAEDIIKSKMESTEDEISDKILSFLKQDLKISDPSKYIDRVRQSYYQDLSTQLKDADFNNGYVFAFTFLDRKFTKSSTRSIDKEQVYNKKIYWNLKDLIYEYEELTELSLYWRFDGSDFEKEPDKKTFKFVEVSFKEINKSLEIHFYNTRQENRRLKENYVLFKINQYLPK